jgi:signal transduction histidine kinase
VSFKVEPTLWQTWWFRISCVILVLLSVWCVYRYRLHQLAEQFNMRLEERVSERTRIARDLHDTMLQSFQGVLLKFHALTFMIQTRPAEACEMLEGLVEEASQAISEGREAVQGLRSSTAITNDLACALTQFGEKLGAEQNGQNRTAFRVDVEGESRDLHPVLRDEVYRIACEAIRNAFHHSGASRIDVDIRYGERQFRVCIRDNGKGIEAQVLDAGGRAGHYGLPGMQERAKSVGGKLAVWTKPESGTGAELTIPASRAYAKSRTPRRSIFLRKGA